MMNRREFLITAAAAQILASSRLIAATAGAVPEVPPFDPSNLKPSDFADADLDMPYNLTYLPRIANSIETEGPDRGFINISVWRGTPQLHPYNTRIMESILTLAWFYASRRKWNQFYANPALRARLELAFEYWCNLQSPDGKFSEYGPQQWNLAATAFSVKFISEALRLLKTGPPITPALHARAIDCCRKAVHATLYDPDLLSHGKSYSNQFTNIFAGGAAFLSMYPDADLWARLKEQVEASPTNLQSPCGYMYEKDGPDLGYTLNTHHENLQMAYHYWRGTPLGEHPHRRGEPLRQMAFDTTSCPSPASPSGWPTAASNAASSMPSFPPSIRRWPIAASSCAPLPRRPSAAPNRSAPPAKKWKSSGRRSIRFPWVSSALCRRTFSCSARITTGTPPPRRWPRRASWCGRLAEKHFVEQLKDTREPIVFTYIRRPGYYAAFASAPKVISEQQRLGLTFVWTPEKGVLLQSQTNGRETAWGTSAGGALPVEATGLDADIQRGQYRSPLPASRRRK